MILSSYVTQVKTMLDAVGTGRAKGGNSSCTKGGGKSCKPSAKTPIQEPETLLEECSTTHVQKRKHVILYNVKLHWMLNAAA